jgi:hypothetical protein
MACFSKSGDYFLSLLTGQFSNTAMGNESVVPIWTGCLSGPLSAGKRNTLGFAFSNFSKDELT